MLQNTMHRQVLILASSQSLFQTVSVMVMTIGGLAGANIANTPTSVQRCLSPLCFWVRL